MERAIADLLAMLVCIIGAFILLIIGWAFNEFMYWMLAWIICTPLYILFENDYAIAVDDWSKKNEE